MNEQIQFGLTAPPGVYSFAVFVHYASYPTVKTGKKFDITIVSDPCEGAELTLAWPSQNYEAGNLIAS